MLHPVLLMSVLWPFPFSFQKGEDGLLELFDVLTRSAVCGTKRIVNWILIELLNHLYASNTTYCECGLDGQRFGELLGLLEKQQISHGTAQQVLGMLVNGDARTPYEIVEEHEWWQITDKEQLVSLCKEAIQDNPEAVSSICNMY